MDERLYNKNIICPVCNNNISITKVKMKACRIVSRDSDFCLYYENTNPILYDIWVCEHCGYSAQSDKFELISDREVKLIKKEILPKWTKRSFTGERSIELSLETFKLALLNAHVRNAKSSELARICIRIAWLYRMKQDEKEQEFLKFALKSYTEAYEKERFPAEKLDEYTCMYMIAELNRRLGNNEEAVKWFSRLIGSSDARKNGTLIEAAREQYQLVKDELEKNKDIAVEG